MGRPLMLVVAGPPGSGKSTLYPVTALGVDAFNIDDRCAQLVGSYRAIPRAVRDAVATECRAFIDVHVREQRSFAVETTLRTDAADAPDRRRPQGSETGKVIAIPEVGGLHHRYERRAA